MSTPPFNISDEIHAAASKAAEDAYRRWRDTPNREAYVSGFIALAAKNATEAVAPLIAVQVLRSELDLLARSLEDIAVSCRELPELHGGMDESGLVRAARLVRRVASGELRSGITSESGRERSLDPDTPARRLASLHAQPHFPIPSCPPTCHCYGTAGFQQWAADGHGEPAAQRRERSDPEGSVSLDDLGPYGTG